MMTLEERAALFYRMVVRPGGGTVWVGEPGYPDPQSLVAVQTWRAATLTLRSGRLIVCDPATSLFAQAAAPLQDRFPRGEWPVFLSTAWEARVHLGAMIRFAEAEPVRWRPARFVGDVDDPAEGGYPAFGVDSGAACFMDAMAQPVYGQMVSPSNPAWREEDSILDTNDGWREVSVATTPEATNVVLFASGYGDGAYPCVIGEDERGAARVLLVLLGVFDAEATRKVADEDVQ